MRAARSCQATLGKLSPWHRARLIQNVACHRAGVLPRHHLEPQTCPSSSVKRRHFGSGIALRQEMNNRRPQPPESNDKLGSHGTENHNVDATHSQSSPGRNTQLAMTLAESDSSDLVTETHVASDPHGVLPANHPAFAILGNSSLVVQRQLELMNVFLGFEQANRYIIMDGNGATLGYIAERDHGIGSTIGRQIFRTHRSFTTHIFDRNEREVLRIHRPFAYINSRIRIYDPIPPNGYQSLESSTALQGLSKSTAQETGAQISPLPLEEMRMIGEARQQWAPLRRKYNLFTLRPFDKMRDENDVAQSTESAASNDFDMAQFAHIDERFLSWDFTLCDEGGNVVGSVNRNFGGFAREIFTDTGVYALRMDAAVQLAEAEVEAKDASETHIPQHVKDVTSMTLDQRAVMLATAVSIDFDYFSRHSGSHMPLPIPMIGSGGAAAEGAGAAGAGGVLAGGASAAGEAGAVVGAAGAAGRAGIGEGAIAGAGTMAGYEAMQRGIYGDGSQGGAAGTSATQSPVDFASPQAPMTPDGEEIFDPDGTFTSQSGQSQERSMWDDEDDNGDSWGGGNGSSGGPTDSGKGGNDIPGGDDVGGGEDGGGWLDSISDFFDT